MVLRKSTVSILYRIQIVFLSRVRDIDVWLNLYAKEKKSRICILNPGCARCLQTLLKSLDGTAEMQWRVINPCARLCTMTLCMQAPASTHFFLASMQ